MTFETAKEKNAYYFNYLGNFFTDTAGKAGPGYFLFTKGKMVMKLPTITVQERSPLELRPHERNARVHSKVQLKQIAASISRFGFNVPILIDQEGRIIAGHGRVEAAKILGLSKVPTIQLDHLSEAERRAFLIADNKIALNATWDLERLGAELLDLSELEFDLTLTGFSLAECDEVIQLQEASTHSSSELTTDNDVPRVPEKATTRLGDRFKLGHHYLLCGDARSKADVRLLMQEQKSDLLFTDPPYNVPINGHVSGLGKTKHREFTMGSGEMSNAQFIAFLKSALGVAASVSKNGALAYVCMDWRGMLPLLTAGQKVFTEFKQLCVWNKSNAGMGTFYRSKHELVFIFKNGKAPHTNTFGLGKTGRYRTNVWDYPGISSMSGHRSEDIARHPTPKPVAMVKDAILDCTRRGDIVLDPFAGSGTTLVAAHSCGRSARLLELDPLYCDVIIERFQRYTGQAAVLTTSGQSFEDVQADRLASSKQVPA